MCFQYDHVFFIRLVKLFVTNKWNDLMYNCFRQECTKISRFFNLLIQKQQQHAINAIYWNYWQWNQQTIEYSIYLWECYAVMSIWVCVRSVCHFEFALYFDPETSSIFPFIYYQNELICIRRIAVYEWECVYFCKQTYRYAC